MKSADPAESTAALDDSFWRKCVFTNCKIRYGGGPMQLLNNRFDNCSFEYFGCAKRTLYFVQQMK
jgi:hypothetical protein